MSGFSSDWLALREPVDHRSVNAGLRDTFVEKLARRDSVSLIDIGCGTGSHLRSLAPHLGPRQHWTLVDYDPQLLVAARKALAAWADRCEERDDGLSLSRREQSITVSFRRADLFSELETALAGAADAVTAAAFFDLVSTAWIERFAQTLARRRLPLYTILTYDGREVWSPPHEADEQILQAFHAHQKTDKGLGVAAGPSAVEAMAKAFRDSGYQVSTAESPWRLGADDASLIAAMAEGSAAAVAETGLVDSGRLSAWRHLHTNAKSCMIGHLDFLAWPSPQ